MTQPTTQPAPHPEAFPRELRAKIRARVYDTMRAETKPEDRSIDRLALAEIMTRAVIAVLIDEWASHPPLRLLTDAEASTVLERIGDSRESLVLSLSMEHRMVLGAVFQKLRAGESLGAADLEFFDGFAALVRPVRA